MTIDDERDDLDVDDDLDDEPLDPPAQMRELILYVARELVDDAEAVEVEAIDEDRVIALELSVAPDDLGKVIGRDGRTARAMRTLLSATSAKLRQRALLDILEEWNVDALVPLGIVARPHGVRGMLRVHPYNRHSDLIGQVDEVWLRSADDPPRACRVDHACAGPKGSVLLRLDGFDAREAAEAVRRFEVCVPRSQFPPAQEGEWYHVDLIGLAVETDAGTRVGEVTAVVDYPSVDCLRIRGESAEREIPLVDGWVVEVELSRGRVVVDGQAWSQLDATG